MPNSVKKLNNLVSGALSNHKISYSLKLIKDFVEAIDRDSFFSGSVFNLPVLDNLCLKIGQKTALNLKHEPIKIEQPKQQPIIYIASELYLSGGHTAVIEDFIRAQPSEKHVIIITDIFHSPEKNAIRKRFKPLPVNLRFLKKKAGQAKLIELQEMWLLLKPKKVFLFNHPQDSVIISAAQPAMPGKLYFYHHVDFKFSLGTSLKHATHIDCNPLTFQHCSDYYKDKPRKNIYLPLICDDLKINAVSNDFMKKGVINTASSGSAVKFLQDYIYQYTKLVPEILKCTQGYHVHIGVLPRKIRALLSQEKKFIYIPWTRSVWKTLLEYNIDAYIASFPIGGGRTAIEVMGAGIPILGHLNQQSVFLSENKLLYPGAFLWKTPEELLTVLKQLTPDILKKHACLARKQYETYYNPPVLAEWFLDEDKWPRIVADKAFITVKVDTLINRMDQKMFDETLFQWRKVRFYLSRIKWGYLYLKDRVKGFGL